MLRTAFALAFTLAGVEGLVSPALAADQTCSALAKIKAELAAGVTLTTLTPGQFHFLEGFYLGVPPTMQGKIPGTGALLIERKGGKGGMIVWTLGALACQPTPVTPQFIDALKGTPTGPLGSGGDEL